MIGSTCRSILPGFARTLILILLISALAIGCSDSTGPEESEPAVLSVTPDSGSPGTIVRIENLRISDEEIDSLRVYFGDRMAPVVRSESGAIVTAVPLFLDMGGAHTPPAEPVDVVVKNVDHEIGRAVEAVTVLALPQAPGEAGQVAAEMRAIADALESIVDALVLDPGREEQHLAGMFAALDSLLGNTDESSLGAAIAAAEADPDQLAILEGILAATHAGDHLASIASGLQGISSQISGYTATQQRLPAAIRPVAPAGAALAVSDDILALKMQFYVIASGFGKQVIAESGETFAQSVGLAAGMVGIVHSLPQVEVTLLILGYLDFVVNKVIVGLLPANLDSIDLQLAAYDLDFLTMTDATIRVNASNTPPQISLQYMINQVLTLMGASGSPSAIESFKDVLIRTSNYFLTTMQGVITSYSSAHPELNLDVELFSVVPTLTWTATASNPVYYDLKTFTPNVVEPLIEDLNWITREETGIGRIYLMPSSSGDARLLPGYYGGAFGEGSVASNVRTLIIGSTLELEIECPAAMNHGDDEEIRIRAGYIGGAETDWTSGIDITIEARGGTVLLESGTTDESGYFLTQVFADVTDAVVIELVIAANGEYETFAGATVEIALGGGLVAHYSTGAVMLEGPVHHGYSHSCDGDPYSNNMYQGVCTPIGTLPVDWASGGWDGPDDPTNFTAFWTGYLFAPLEGSYRIVGWVDGDVMVEVNGERISYVETPGSTYSGYVTLAAETWVPVFMYFETNGGSNNMAFKWTLPGESASEFVPRKYLNDTPGDESTPSSAPARPSNVRILRRL